MNLTQQFQMSRDAFHKDPNPTLEKRVDRIQKLKRVLLSNIDLFGACIAKDFGQRSVQDTMLEILPIVNNIH